MPGKEGEPPTPQQLTDLRKKALQKIEDVGKASFLSADIAKISESDHYLTRFWLHVFDLPGEQEDEAAHMILETLKWRNDFGVDKISRDNVNQAFFDKGTVFTHNRDKDGKKLLTFTVGRHIKGAEKMDEMKRFFVYYLERLEREEQGDLITIVFDCRNAGLKNMDMEFIQFIIGVFKDYYPEMLNYILVFEMPWVLNAAWKIIKAWLPAAAVKKIKFLTKSNMGEYITDDNRLEAWGGSDPWEYCFEEESVANVVNNHSKTNGTGSYIEVIDDSLRMSQEDALKKKSVTFAEVRGSPSLDSMSSFSSSGNSGPEILSLNPSQEVVFSASAGGELMARFQVSNICERRVGYKIKTTSPEKYKVKPSSAILQPGQSEVVELRISGSNAPVSLIRDKFLVTAIYIEDTDNNNARFQELLKSSKPDAQYRLRCQLAGEQQPPTSISSKLASSSSSAPEDPGKQLSLLLRKINQIAERNVELENQQTNNFRIQVVLLGLTLFLLILVWFYLPSSSTMCPPVSEPTISSSDEL
ncbi:motile sperm domain-containing protein 2 [Eurytemora carolleeae]|uniref:motile sperm domain-containing protein 2 n=1 Tax=Eurytemora carolleeae TaxID=1294199 RepID=UPI000C7653D3|nr:motile sperm domain-containing protein 2 [Eurytemora carolleeae]XP_023342820.1 motile sperm domain-containing protein 2 [Eurytemora carolleeae]|eukprot:XP_023342819.1 motile sperm domain-containing protein 2-like [Eurytemora affinis]